MEAADRFCLTWESYDLLYGIPVEVAEWLQRGEHVMVNVSRQVIAAARRQFSYVRVVFVQVPLETTLTRIRRRGRENENDATFQRRLQRAMDNPSLADADYVLNNSGTLEAGASRLSGYLRRCMSSDSER
jgi:ribose 1,5-bisphosphokinase